MKEMIGTMINSDGSLDSKVEHRVGMASRMVRQLEAQCWKGRSYRRGQIQSGECDGDTHIDVLL